MKLWMSAEVDADVYEVYRGARADVESEVNRLLEAYSGPDRIEKWAYIAIIRAEDHPDYSEFTKLHKRRGVVEFRLKVAHREFKTAPANRARGMLLESLIRSREMFGDLGVDTTRVPDVGELSNLGSRLGWL